MSKKSRHGFRNPKKVNSENRSGEKKFREKVGSSREDKLNWKKWVQSNKSW